ncbi:MAG: rod shape-determining protein MreC [Bacteroidia bacterium]|nr:rod shape-determining protein MreC [Bacteroidia bacterium]
MRELILYLLRLKSLILFLFLQCICLFLIVRYNNSQRAIFISSSNAISGFFYSNSENIRSFFVLRAENESIAQKNAALLRELYQGSALKGPIEGELIDSQFIFIPAKVINNSIHGNRNSITLNIGRSQGIEPRMGVITEDGVVGIVQNVSKHYSKILSILHADVKVSVRLKSQGVLGSVRWNGEDHRRVSIADIPKHYDISPGDTVVTSGYSSFFPDGIVIGTIEDYEVISGSNYYDVSVALSLDMANLDYVYAVRHRLKEEIISLEAENE